MADLNKMKQRPQKQMIVFKSNVDTQNSPDDVHKTTQLSCNDDSPVLVPDWFDHPLGNKS